MIWLCLLLVYIVTRATVVSVVVWERMKGAIGAMGECVCVGCCWRQEVRALSANSGSLNLGLRQRTNRQLLATLALQSVHSDTRRDVHILQVTLPHKVE